MSNNLKARIRVKDLKWQQEYFLIHKAGFHIISRNGDEVIFGKRKSGTYPNKKPPWDDATDLDLTKLDKTPESLKGKAVSLINDNIPEHRKNELNKRCQNIYDMFENPEMNKGIIRRQIHNMGQTLNSEEQEYVENWSYQYVL